jgi:calcineurin-like phosphoesterase family protein
MKILVVGDPHFKYELSYSSAFVDGRKEEWEAVKKTIHDEAKSCDAIVLIGDEFNARHNHSSVIREFIDFLNGFGDKEVHILVGNHERYGASTALDFLKSIKQNNWFIYTEPKQTVVAGQKAMMIPFMAPALLGVETKEEGAKAIVKMFPKDIWPLAFIHHGINEARMNNIPIDFFNEIVLPKKELEKHFSHVFAGHIHGKQYIPPSIYMTGNIFTCEVGEHSKSIWTYETSKNGKVTVKEIPLPVRGIYKIIWEARDEKEIIPSNSIVKCYVTDKKTPIDEVKKFLKFFDASTIIEQYPNKRTKIHFEEGGLDLSMDSLLKLYADTKKIVYGDLKEGFELLIKI